MISLYGVRSENFSKEVKESQNKKEVMASDQIMSKAIARAVAEGTRIAIQTMVEAWVERAHDRSGPKVGSPTMKQLTFSWNAQDKYSELKTFRLEVNNILSTYNTQQADKLALVKNWLGRKGIQYLENINDH